MADGKQKILAFGACHGQFKQFFNRLETVNKKSGPFDLVFVAGEFFSDINNDELEAYKNGFKLIPSPTYILGPTSEATSKYLESLTLDEDEICTNLVYLGKRGLYTTSTGLRIAYLSGLESKIDGATPWTFSKADVLAVRDSCLASKSAGDYRGIDFLITQQPPTGIIEIAGKETSSLISWLALQIKPRYHFCSGSENFIENSPYRTPKDHTTQLDLSTRLIILAKIGNSSKEKYVYAASVQPVEKMRVMDLLQKTTDETICPYLKLNFSIEHKGNVQNQEASQFFFDMDTQNQHQNRKRNQNNFDGSNKKRQRQVFDQEKCWFCLSSPDVEKHMVITVGDDFYLALPKGPINENHVLLLSINHIQSSSLLSNESFLELSKFKDALTKYFTSINMVVCFFERNYRSSHLLIDCIPVEKSLDWQIKLAIEDKAEEYGLQFETLPKRDDPTDFPDKGPFFAVELPDESIMMTRQMKNFPIQLSREIMCAENLLNSEDKIDWRECKLSKDEEIDLVKQFRTKFATFDFNV